MDDKFPGFTIELFTFLTALKNNNNRDWFNEYKDRYLNNVANPMMEFLTKALALKYN